MENNNNTALNGIEELARRANDANSMRDYKPGSATAEIAHLIEGAREEAAQAIKEAQTQKQKEDIAGKLSRYENGIVSYFEEYYSNEAACPSVMVAGPANFPIHKKEKQNARRETLQEEYNRLEELRHGFRSGLNVISSADPEAVEALEKKISQLKAGHATKIKANAYFRANKTLIGFPEMSEDAARDWQARHDDTSGNGGYWYRVPFMEYDLTNENAEIKRLESRLSSIKQQKESTLTGWDFNGGHVVIDNENARIGVYWDEKKRGSDLEELYSKNGDRNYNVPRLLWSPRFERWQCFINPRNISQLRNSKTYAPTDEESQKKRAISDAFKDAVKQAEEKDSKESLFSITGQYRHHDVLKPYGFIAYYKNDIKRGLEKHPTAKNTGAGSIEKWFIDDGKVEEATAALIAYIASEQKPSPSRFEFKPAQEQEETPLMLPARIYSACVAIKEAAKEDASIIRCRSMLDDLEKRIAAMEGAI